MYNRLLYMFIHSRFMSSRIPSTWRPDRYMSNQDIFMFSHVRCLSKAGAAIIVGMSVIGSVNIAGIKGITVIEPGYRVNRFLFETDLQTCFGLKFTERKLSIE